MPPPLEEHFVDPQREKVNIHEVGHLKETWGGSGWFFIFKLKFDQFLLKV